MSVCEIGVGRTGSRSVAKAVEMLGLKAKHGLRGLPGHQRTQINRHLLSGRIDLISLYQDYDYVGDFPSIHWRELHRLDPSIKFILTVRSVDDWWRGCLRRWKRVRYLKSRFNFPEHGVSSTDLPSFIWSFKHFGCYGMNEDKWKQGFLQHYLDVLEHFGRDVLVFNVFAGDGWEALCQFLDLPVPDVPFPHTHRST